MFSLSTLPMNGSRSRIFSPPGTMVSSGMLITPASASRDRRVTARLPMAMNTIIITTAPTQGPRDSGANRPAASSKAPRLRCSRLRTKPCTNRNRPIATVIT
ncbi:hypothetical protein D3C81_1742530 [compost metagenome]